MVKLVAEAICVFATIQGNQEMKFDSRCLFWVHIPLTEHSDVSGCWAPIIFWVHSLSKKLSFQLHTTPKHYNSDNFIEEQPLYNITSLRPIWAEMWTSVLSSTIHRASLVTITESSSTLFFLAWHWQTLRCSIALCPIWGKCIHLPKNTNTGKKKQEKREDIYFVIHQIVKKGI